MLTLGHTTMRIGNLAASLELPANHDGRSYTMADARGHVAVRTDDLHETWAELIVRAAEDYRDPGSCDDRYASTKDGGGDEVEVVTN
ncbi:hypothetical protein EGH21_16375 [Halomicroarcula sp. F13]|uniref:Uncharacterized protein n=1 Tax=Haloarcula rubra TaxID=2487747 RepID=A0AAW4PTT8_9EURY|nr:hypothetical protein [Halomicroarcula rubra]MBX0324606.1 hypothetical protein [Halomicroarcula rubra]